MEGVGAYLRHSVVSDSLRIPLQRLRRRVTTLGSTRGELVIGYCGGGRGRFTTTSPLNGKIPIDSLLDMLILFFVFCSQNVRPTSLLVKDMFKYVNTHSNFCKI